MERLNEKYHQLALAYFNGTISFVEEEELFAFISSDSAGLEQFRKWEKEWMISSNKDLSVYKDWKQLQQRMIIRDSFATNKNSLKSSHDFVPFFMASMCMCCYVVGRMRTFLCKPR